MDYAQTNLAKYPYKIVRFAEISSFTKGFAATAYPGTFFITESFGFGNEIPKNGKTDIITEQVSHELSHTWWGNAGIHPEYMEGSAVLTETLAMYSELMMYKKTYGEENLEDRVALHRDLYLSQKGFEREVPLYKASPGQPFLNYDKGMMVMYRIYQIMGEEKINTALRNFYHRYAYPALPPITTDLVNELKAVAEPSRRQEIEDLFLKFSID